MAIGSALLWSNSAERRTILHRPRRPSRSRAERAGHDRALRPRAGARRAPTASVMASLQAGGGASPTELRRAPTVIRRELWPSHGASPLDAEIGRRRHVAFVDQALDVIHQAAHGVGKGVTINDLLLGAIAGGLRRWVEERHGTVASLRVQVPVSMHRQDEAPGQFRTRLLHQHRFARRRARREAPRALCQRADARPQGGPGRGGAVRPVRRRGARVQEPLPPRAQAGLQPARLRLSVSNVRGPAGSLFLAGRKDRADVLTGRDRTAPRTADEH